jgi:hypothetical protein
MYLLLLYTIKKIGLRNIYFSTVHYQIAEKKLF